MRSQNDNAEALSRSARMLRTALGAEIAGWLDDASVVEIMLNPDGRLWLDRLTSGLEDTGARLSAEDGERIIRLVAHHVGAEVHAGAPRVSAELPETGERFEGLLPPVVYAPAFAIRKLAVAVFSLDDYVAAGVMARDQAAILRASVGERKNILVAGGTSTGKTTLANALLAEIAKTSDRVVLIEDTRELQCATPNLVSLRTKDGVASLSDLVRSSLRLRPDRYASAPPTEPTPIDPGDVQNMQDRKLAFVNAPADRRTVSPDRLTAPASRYVLQAGAVIPAALVTGIQALRRGGAQSLNQTGQQIVGRNLNIQPTLTIRPGFPVRVIVTRDLVLAPYLGPGDVIATGGDR